MQRIAAIGLIALLVAALLANVVAPYPFAAQFRDLPNTPASRAHWLGTDALGRDRLSRLLYGARVSMLLAPSAAAVSVLLAAGLAIVAVMGGPWCERATLAAADLFLSVPWIFLLLAARAVLPLNSGPIGVALVTFGLLGVLGWAGPARVLVAAIRQHLRSDFVLFARSYGSSPVRLALIHLAPNLVPPLLAQFLIATPTYLLAEANLGILGLGIPEPVPSWGGLISELESVSAIAANPWSLAPAILLILVVGCFHLVVSADKQAV